MPSKTLINGTWVPDPIKDYSDGSKHKHNGNSIIEAQQATINTLTIRLQKLELLLDRRTRQHDCLANGMAGCKDSKSITDVRKVVTHTSKTYPTK